MSLALKELKPPLPCERLINFMANWRLLEEEDDDPWLLKNPNKLLILFDDDEPWFLSSWALCVSSWKSLSSLLPLSSDDDDDEERSFFSSASLLNESFGLSFSESPESSSLSQLLKPCPKDGSSVVVGGLVFWLPKRKRRAWLRSENDSADAEAKTATRHTRMISARDVWHTTSDHRQCPTDNKGQGTWRHSDGSLQWFDHNFLSRMVSASVLFDNEWEGTIDCSTWCTRL